MSDIEAAARAAVRHALDAVGVRPNNADDFDEIVDNAARSALAHATRGEGDAPKPRVVVVAGPAVRAMGAIIDKMRGNPSSPPRPPATGEADPDPRGEDREAVEAAQSVERDFLPDYLEHALVMLASHGSEADRGDVFLNARNAVRQYAAERGEGGK